jgi:aminopeptidase
VIYTSAVAAPIPSALLEPEQLARYADAVVHGCLALREDELFFVQAHPEHRDAAVALAESAYRAGARHVSVDYQDPRVRAARIRHAADEHLGPVPPWEPARLRAQLAPDTAVVTILGEADPGVFDDLSPDRVSGDHIRTWEKLGWYRRRARAGHRRWTGMAWPTAHWAGLAYPELPLDEGLRRLAADLLLFCRVGPDDPPGHEGWSSHVRALADRARALDELALERLELRSPGTSLDLRLSPGTLWVGGWEENFHGRFVAPNFPTEESYTSPDFAGTEGTFACTRPLSFRGRLIHGIAGEFRGGRLVRLDVPDEADRAALAAFIAADRHADRLGEVALVDGSSRIGRTGRVYANTLLDENAVAHIAFGVGFEETRTPEAGTRTVNKASTHLDVMIGSDDLDATGIRRGGERVPLIRDGAWRL